MQQLKQMYSIAYGEIDFPAEDTNYRQLELALGEMMNIHANQNVWTMEVAMASVASAICNYQLNPNWPSLTYMLFVETWSSLPKTARETILILTLPRLSTSECHPAFLWFIDAAIEMEMNALLHISFIEDAIKSDDDYVRSTAAYSLVQLPMSYWESIGETERKVELIARLQQDPSPDVRMELGT